MAWYYQEIVGNTKMPDYIIKKRQAYYARLQVPTHLRDKLGRTEFVKSLKTKDIREADRRKHKPIAQWQNILELADGGRPSSELERALAVVRSDSSDRDTQEDIIAGFDREEAETYFQATKIAHGDDILFDLSPKNFSKFV